MSNSGKVIASSQKSRRLVIPMVVGAMLFGPVWQAMADNNAIAELRMITILIGSIRRKSTNVVSFFPDVEGAVDANAKITDDELSRIAAIKLAVDAQSSSANKDKVGQASIDGQDWGVNVALGASAVLSYDVFDPVNNVLSSDATIASVRYDAILDPVLMPDYQLIGTSTDAANHFQLPWTVDGFEPLIRATPLDINGQPVIFDGVDGVNGAPGFVGDPGSEFSAQFIFDHAADYVPEPSALMLVCVIPLIIRRRRSR